MHKYWCVILEFFFLQDYKSYDDPVIVKGRGSWDIDLGNAFQIPKFSKTHLVLMVLKLHSTEPH